MDETSLVPSVSKTIRQSHPLPYTAIADEVGRHESVDFAIFHREATRYILPPAVPEVELRKRTRVRRKMTM